MSRIIHIGYGPCKKLKKTNAYKYTLNKNKKIP